jgi:hypothetical protein
MYPTETVENDGLRDQVNAWRVVRWLVTTAAALLLVTLFLTQTSSTEAAAPVPNVAACQNGNYYACSYILGAFGNWNGYAWNNGYVWGNGVNWVSPSYVAPAYIAPTNYGYWNGFYGWPNFIGANFCPSGNFTACNANNGWWWNGIPWWNGTGVFNGNYVVVAPSGNTITVGPPFRPKEVESPAVVTAPVAQPTTITASAPAVTTIAAPAAPAPAANVATALNAPQAPVAVAPAATTQDVHIFSAPTTAPAATTVDPEDHKG